MFQLLAIGAISWSTLLAVGSTPAQAKPAPTPTTKPATLAAAPVAPAAPAPKTYTVASGDNLSDIATSQGLDSWRPLWNVNTSITDPNMIYAGQVLTVPTGVTTDRPVPAQQAATAAVLDQASSANTAQVRRNASVAPANYAQGSGDIFARIRQRESGGNYAENTGNGYYGAYQYDIGTWGNYGGYARADLAPPAVQDAKAAQTYAQRGCSPWPNTCY